MNDRTWITRGCGVLAIVLIVSALVPEIENVLNWVVTIVVVTPFLAVLVREGYGELVFALECRRPPDPADIAAFTQREQVRTVETLDARPVWQVVPTDESPTVELEGPR